MYLSNKYTEWYNRIISSAKTRGFELKLDATRVLGYVEQHHILPASLGGSKKKDNLVFLTAREHFICHWLLTKMCSGQYKIKMAYAFNRMLHCYSPNQSNNRYTPNPRLYALLKIKNAKNMVGREVSAETRARLSAAKKGKRLAQEVYDRQAIARSNHPRTAKHNQKISASNLNKPKSDKAKQNMSLNHADVSGENNPNAQCWKITSPDGVDYFVCGALGLFCSQHGLNRNKISALARGLHSPKQGIYSKWKAVLL